MASWYLKHIIVHDLQTREKFYFICENWFGVDKSDGQIDRILPVCGEAQKTRLKYLISKKTKEKLSDDHLWLSVLAKPALSSFSRLDRLTCCFFLLNLTMMVNILYYEIDKSTASSSGFQIGPIKLTTQQVGVGIVSNLIIFPPSFLLIQILRRAKKRYTRFDMLKEKIKKANRAKYLYIR